MNRQRVQKVYWMSNLVIGTVWLRNRKILGIKVPPKRTLWRRNFKPQGKRISKMNTDPIADMLTRIRNANLVSHPSVEMPSSKLKVALAKLLKSEGFITDYSERAEGHFKYLTIELKYDEANKPVISNLQRVSKPGLRNYCKAKNLPQVLGGMGIAVVSTSKGLLTDRKARKENLGGEVLCYVY